MSLPVSHPNTAGEVKEVILSSTMQGRIYPENYPAGHLCRSQIEETRPAARVSCQLPAFLFSASFAVRSPAENVVHP